MQEPVLFQWFCREGEVVREGDRVRARGALEELRPPLNPGEFSWRDYLRRQGVQAVFRSQGDASFTLLGREEPGGIKELRGRISGVISRALPGVEGKVLLALLLGETEGLPTIWKERFRLTGLTHLLAISGQHIGLVATLLGAGLGAVRAIPAPVAALLSAAGAVFYVLLAGSPSSAVRAGAAAVVAAGGVLLRRRPHPLNVLGVAVCGLLVANPFFARDPGFTLSVAGTWGLLRLSPLLREVWRAFPPHGAERERTGLTSWLTELGCISLAAQLGVWPLQMQYFGSLTPWAVLANLPSLPLTSAALVLGWLGLGWGGIYPELGGFFFTLAGWAVRVFLKLVDWFASWPGNGWTVPALPWWLVACYYGGVEWGCDYLRPYPFPARQKLCRRRALALGCAILSIAAVGAAARACSPVLEATFLAVGEGDAIYLQVPGGRHLLIDVGPGQSRSGGAGAAERVVVPFLRWRGVKTLDLVLLTHAHADHVGGLRWVAEKVRIRRLGVAEGLLEGNDALKREVEGLQKRGRVQTLVELRAGDCWQLGCGLRLEVLSPLSDPAVGTDPNSSAMAIKVIYRRTGLLCLSDLPRTVQERLVTWKGEDLRAELLKVPHHGSRDAWYQTLWEEAGPRWAVISVGRNAFRHPHAEVEEGLRALGVAVLRTDRVGAVTALTIGRGWWIKTFAH